MGGQWIHFCVIFKFINECKIRIRGVQQKPRPDPPAQPVRSGPRTGRPDADDGRQRVSASRTWKQRVGWRVFSPKPEETRPNRDMTKSQYHDLFFSDVYLRRSCSSSISASPSSISASSSLICALRRRHSLFVLNVPSSSSPPSLRLVFASLKFSSFRFCYLWNCCLLLFLFFGFVDMFFGFVDLLILFFKNRSSVFDLCISIEIKADCHPPEPNPTQLMAFRGRWRVWNFSTRLDRVGCGLGTNPTQTDPWTALRRIMESFKS